MGWASFHNFIKWAGAVIPVVVVSVLTLLAAVEGSEGKRPSVAAWNDTIWNIIIPSPQTWAAVGVMAFLWVLLFLWSGRMARQYETVVGPTQKVEQVGEAEVKREVPLAQAEKLPPLKQHYETDFKEGRGTLIMMESFNQDITFPDGKIVRIEYARHLNYAARSIFLAIYIPADTRAVAICEYVKDHIDDYTRSDLDIEMGGSGSEPERSSDLIFTGRVFVYHEGHIPLADRGALDAAYREKNLRLQFRSTDYVLAAMQGKKQATAASASS